MQYPQLLQTLSCNKVLLFSNANGVLGQLARNRVLKTTVMAYRHTDVQPDVENLKQCICRQGAPEGSEVPPTLLS